MAASTQAKGVRTQHPDYIKFAPVWKKARDAAEGERAIHAAGTEYLPRLKDESAEDYAARKGRTPFFNTFWRTISGLKGMLFRKAPQVEVPAGVVPYLDNIDAAGTPLDLFMQQCAEDVLSVNRVGVMIDYPQPVDGPITVAQQAALGLRPSMQRYPAESITNWRTTQVNNVTVLQMVTLKESAPVQGKDEFAHEFEDRYRVLDLFNGMYRQRLFRINNEKDEQIGADSFPIMNGAPMTEIPFVFFAADSGAAGVDAPPLEDLLNMNLHHYTVSADYEHGCHFSGLPTPYVAGYTPATGDNTLAMGGSAAYCFDNPQAKIAFAEITSAFAALTANLDSKKQEMAVLGARMLESSKAAVESAETQRQRVAGEQSQLGGMAQVMSMIMTRALETFSEWAGFEGEVTYEITRDFIPTGMTPEELTALLAAVQAGRISFQTYFENLQRGEIIAADVTVEEEQERIASQNPPMPEPEVTMPT